MSLELLKKDLEATDRRVLALEDTVEELSDSLKKIVALTQRIQNIGTGIGLYFILDNLGLVHALKLALKGVGV